jgi:hypothetical protein
MGGDGCKGESAAVDDVRRRMGDYEAGNAGTKEENSAGEGFRQWSTKSGIGAAQPCMRKYLTGGNARETEISPVQSRRRSLGFYIIRK